jgi:hypothetical protein
LSSVDPLAELGDWDAKAFGDLNGAKDAKIAAAAFDPADIGAVKVGQLGELLLREIQCFTLGANVVAKLPEGGFQGRHPLTIAD